MKKITNVILLSLILFGCNAKISSSTSSGSVSTSISNISSSSSSSFYIDYNVSEELMKIVERTLKKDIEYVDKEDFQEVDIGSNGFKINGISKPEYGFLVVNKDGKSGIYSLITKSLILQPKVESNNATISYIKNDDIGFFLMIFDSITGSYDVIDSFGNLINSGSDFTTVDLRKLETYRKDDTFYLVDNLSNTTKYYKYNDNGSLTNVSFIEGSKSVDISIFNEYYKYIDLKEYGNDGYYAAINYLGDFVIYDFYRGSEKYSSYEFSQFDSINLVGNKLIVQKNNDELVTSINYVSGETEQLNLDVDIIFVEGKPYKDENGLYKYFANAYYIQEENDIKYISYLMDEDCNLLFEVEHINLLRLEYFNGTYFDVFNKIFVDEKLNVTSEIIHDKYDFVVRGELLTYSTSNGKGAMDSKGNVVLELDKNSYIISNPINGYMYINRNTEIYRYNYLIGEEERINYDNFVDLYGNLYIAYSSSSKTLMNEKETIYSYSGLADYAIININFKNKKIFYFAESAIGGNNKGKFIYTELN